MRLVGFALSLASLAGCDPVRPITAPGKVLFDWDASRSSRTSFRVATIGVRTSRDFVVTLDDKAPFVVAVHLEVAPVEFEEDGKKVAKVAPVAFKAIVRSNHDWDLSGRCPEGPNFVFPLDGTPARPFMVLDCEVIFDRKSGVIFKSTYELQRWLSASGDGTLRGLPEQGVTIE